MILSKTGADMLVRHEGLRLKRYKDTKGIDTIGVGHNLVAAPTFEGRKIPSVIDKEFAMRLFQHDVEIHEEELFDKAPWVMDLDTVRRDIFINMAFNMGTGKFPGGWPIFCRQVRARDYASAAKNMRTTPWFRQVKSRGEELADLMEHGRY